MLGPDIRLDAPDDRASDCVHRHRDHFPRFEARPFLPDFLAFPQLSVSPVGDRVLEGQRSLVADVAPVGDADGDGVVDGLEDLEVEGDDPSVGNDDFGEELGPLPAAVVDDDVVEINLELHELRRVRVNFYWVPIEISHTFYTCFFFSW